MAEEKQDKLPDAVKELQSALKNDPELYYVYQANIAMAFEDEYVSKKREKGGKLNTSDMHEVSNNAAKRFLNQFIKH